MKLITTNFIICGYMRRNEGAIVCVVLHKQLLITVDIIGGSAGFRVVS
jgi:hypothetical protein